MVKWNKSLTISKLPMETLTMLCSGLGTSASHSPLQVFHHMKLNKNDEFHSFYLYFQNILGFLY